MSNSYYKNPDPATQIAEEVAFRRRRFQHFLIMCEHRLAPPPEPEPSNVILFPVDRVRRKRVMPVIDLQDIDPDDLPPVMAMARRKPTSKYVHVGCGNCRFYHHLKDGVFKPFGEDDINPIGRCHRRPPTEKGWPRVNRWRHWCGEHEFVQPQK